MRCCNACTATQDFNVPKLLCHSSKDAFIQVEEASGIPAQIQMPAAEFASPGVKMLPPPQPLTAAEVILRSFCLPLAHLEGSPGEVFCSVASLK